MLVSNAPPFSLRRHLSTAGILRMSTDALVAIVALVVVLLWFEQPFEGRYVIVAMLIFALTFPGSQQQTGDFGQMAREVLLNWFLVAAILLFFGYASGYLASFPVELVTTWALVTPFTIVLGHAALPRLLPRVMEMESLQRAAVVVGANDLGARLATQIKNTPLLGIRMQGVFDDRKAERRVTTEGVPTLGTMGDLAAYVKRHRVDLIYIALPMASHPRILNLLNQLRDTTASIYFVPDIFMFDLIQARVDSINGIPVVAVCETPFYGSDGIVKTVSDYLIALTVLSLMAPLMLAIAAGVRLSSPGPILFKQRRYGLDGKEIVVYKFRSMTVLEDGATVRQATRDDQRITAFGRFLRKTSLDELPQFINVLQGRMSVVGPRPHAVSHNEEYRKLIDGYMMRHKVKPGVTGWAQVNGFRGETDTVEKMQKRIEYDLSYLRNWSLRLDLLIVLRTVLLVFGDRRAY